MDLRPSSQSQKRSLARACERYADQLNNDERAREYLARRGLLPFAVVLGFGAVSYPEPGHDRYAGRLAIPFIGPGGNVYDIRYRCIEDHDCKDNKCAKYLGDEGKVTRLYNTRALVAPSQTIFVTEGEMDAATIAACGWPSVGVPGASSWKSAYRPRLFGGFSRVIVIGDGDDAGKSFVREVVRSMPDSEGKVMPPGHDVNSIFVERGKDGLTELLKGNDGE